MKLHHAAIAAISFIFSACNGNSTSGTAESGDGHNHEQAGDEIVLTDVQMKTVGITTGTITRRNLSEAVRATGEIAVNPQDRADVTPLMPGIVSRILVTEGSVVRAGQAVAVIENPEIAVMAQDYHAASLELDLASRELERQEALAAAGAGVRRNLDSARTAHSLAASRVASLTARLRLAGITPASLGKDGVPSSFTVTAPVGGTVGAINAVTGGYTDMTVPLMTITDNSAAYCSLNIFEKDLPAVAKGQKVFITLLNTPSDSTITGTVEEVNRTLDPATKSVAVRVAIPASERKGLIAGMAVRAMIESGETAVDALPDDAIVTSEGQEYVFVLEGSEDGHSHFHRTPVTTGLREDGYTQVVLPEGTAPDAQIVTKGAFYLGSMTADHGEHNH